MNDEPYEVRLTASAERNKEPILGVLREIMPPSAKVLEIASGTGQHAVHFAGAFPGVTWQPTDFDPELQDIAGRLIADAGLDNILPPLVLDVTAEPWPDERADVIYCTNMIHIAPWECCIGLLNGAERILDDGGLLFMYGPYKVGGKHTAPTNEAFDQRLRDQDPAWGIRNLDDVALEARRRGLHLIRTVSMPANNFSLIFRRTEMVSLED